MPSLVEIGPLVLENIFAISLPFSLENSMNLHLNKLETPLPKDALFPNLVDIGHVVLEKKVKSFLTNGWTDGRQAIRKAHLSFQLMS